MKRAAIVVGLALMCVTVSVSTAEAKDMSGRLGVGADQALGFYAPVAPTSVAPFGGDSDLQIPGVSVVYQINKVLGLQFIGSIKITEASSSSGSTSTDFNVIVWNTALRGIFATGLTDDVNLGLFAGFSIIGRSASETAVNTVDASALHFSFEAGMRPEYFITDYFSIHTQVGFVVSLLNEDNSGYADGGFDLNFFQNASLLGNAGFTFWF